MVIPKNYPTPDRSGEFASANTQLTRVYGHSHGWKMFDSRYLTDAVQSHLAKEVGSLNALLTLFPHYRRFVEVGCGYGRLLEWSIEKGLSYGGLELVPWMVHFGQVRIRRLLTQYPWAEASIHCLGAEAVETLFLPAGTRMPTVLFFPFNCLGNVIDVGGVLASVARTSCNVIVSTFNTRPDTTAIRLEYYTHCGFSMLESDLRDEGTLIRSREGLHTFAYSDEYYRNVFDRFGFSLETVLGAGKHGHLLYFRNRDTTDREPASAAHNEATRPRSPSCGMVTVRLTALIDGTTPGVRKPRQQDDRLFTFDESQRVVARITDDELSVEINRHWDPGTTVRIEIVGPDIHEPTSRVAVVKRVLSKTPGRYQVTLWLIPSTASTDE